MDMIKTMGKWLNSFNNQTVMWAEPDIAGYLEKRGGNFTTWKSRFFILQGSTLFYFQNPFNIQSPLGVLPMEGSGLETAGVEEGGSQRKWCFRIKLASQFAMAKRSVYVFAAPSKQAQEEWLENLRYASSTRADLKASLHKLRRVGADIRFKLSKSPANTKMIEKSRRGNEGFSLQAEMSRLRKQLVFLNHQAVDITSQCEQVEASVMFALSVWDLFAQHLDDKNRSNYTYKLQSELNLTKELTSLLVTKADYMRGSRLEFLDEDARTELSKICEKALTKIHEHQTKIRIKAPRYTMEVNPRIFLENDIQFKHTSDIFLICSKVTANKKLLVLHKRAAKENEKEARFGWIISKIGSIKSVTNDTTKSAVKDIATEFSKKFSSTKKFIDNSEIDANKLMEKETTSGISKQIDKDKVLQTSTAKAAKYKAHKLATTFNRDMTNGNEFMSKLSVRPKGKKTLKQDDIIVMKDGISKIETSLGWKALNKMKLQRFGFQSLNLKSKLFSSFMVRSKNIEPTSSERFKFNPKYLSMLKSRPKSANASVSPLDFWGTGNADDASTSHAYVPWIPRPQIARISTTALAQRKTEQ